jgi:predicted transcriptional regulator
MTDLCLEAGAEMNCEAPLQSAFGLVSANLDAMQALASLRLSQQRPQDASQIMEEVYGRISSMREKINARTVIEEITGAPDPVDLQGLLFTTLFASNKQ